MINFSLVVAANIAKNEVTKSENAETEEDSPITLH